MLDADSNEAKTRFIPPLPAVIQSKLAPEKDMLTRNEWPRDMSNIRKLGMEYVHMGEFAWIFMNPEEGKYNFDWLEAGKERRTGIEVNGPALERCARAGP